MSRRKASRRVRIPDVPIVLPRGRIFLKELRRKYGAFLCISIIYGMLNIYIAYYIIKEKLYMLKRYRFYKGDKMKVFISWSGHKSFEVAKVLKEWIPCIIQDIEPYFSSEDIDKGTRWSTDIAKELEEASFGILCVTKDNLESQWLNFEAGALSKAIEKARVCPFLFDLKPSEIFKSPILQFQMTNVDRDDVFKLFKSMNDCLEEDKLEDTRLEKTFSVFWPKMDEAFKNIEEDVEDNTNNIKKDENKAAQNEILEEMLELLRTQQMILKSPEALIPPEYIRFAMKSAGHNFESELLNRVPKGLLSELSRTRRNLKRFEEMYNNVGDELNAGFIKDYIAEVHNLLGVEFDLLEILGLNKYVRVIRR